MCVCVSVSMRAHSSCRRPRAGLTQTALPPPLPAPPPASATTRLLLPAPPPASVTALLPLPQAMPHPAPQCSSSGMGMSGHMLAAMCRQFLASLHQPRPPPGAAAVMVYLVGRTPLGAATLRWLRV